MSEALELVAESPIVTSFIPAAHVPDVWDHVQDLLRPAVERSHGRWSMTHVLGALITGHYNLWVVFDKMTETYTAALITQLVSYPGCNMVSVQFLGGEGFKEWGDELLDLLERFAKEMGCNGIETTARFGFWPFFKRRGYTKSYAVYECNFGE